MVGQTMDYVPFSAEGLIAKSDWTFYVRSPPVSKKNAASSTTERFATAPDPRFRPVVAAFLDDPAVTSGSMMSSYGLKVNGKILAMYGREKFVAKLPKPRVDELVSSGIGERFDPGHGRLMKEWIAIPAHSDRWIEFAREAYAFVKQGAATTQKASRRSARG
jgi:TfoX/Sxy family transcriptional regulator of competence genes